MNSDLKYALIEMKQELESNRLKVILIPQKEPTNSGASIRAVESRNCEWYRDFCSEFPSNVKTKSRKFKTKIKRRNVTELLDHLIKCGKSRSKYSQRLIKYAEHRINQLMEEYHD